MPLTLLAHQGPLLPLVRRHGRHLDAVTLLVGSMAPDFAYVFDGTDRIHLWAHGGHQMITFCVPVTLAVAWIAVRILAPVVPDHLPSGPPFHLTRYRALTSHRFGWVRSPLCAAIGALSHVGLDQFTHKWGWFARHIEWYRTPLIDERYLGKVWAPFEVMQYLGHVTLSAMCLWLMARYLRDGALAGVAATMGPPRRTVATLLVLWSSTAVGAAIGVAYVAVDPQDESTDLVRLALAGTTGLVIGSILVDAIRNAARVTIEERG